MRWIRFSALNALVVNHSRHNCSASMDLLSPIAASLDLVGLQILFQRSDDEIVKSYIGGADIIPAPGEETRASAGICAV